MINNLTTWFNKHKTEFILLVIILATAAFLRLYKIDQYMTFLGDEGRDVIVVKRLITEGDLIFIGPTTSVGNMYLGPSYYYMMAPFLVIWQLSPVGPAVMVVIISLLTLILIYLCGKIFFSKEVGFFAASLYAVSPAIIITSRSSWNPNPMPFFAVIVILALYKLITSKNNIWLLLISASLAFALQMHYLGLLLIPVIVIFWIWHFLTIRHEPSAIRHLIIYSLLSTLLFTILLSPLIIFDLHPNHRFLNFNAFKKFFLERAATEEHLATVNLNPVNALPRVIPLYNSFFERFVVAKNTTYAVFLSILVIVGWFAAKLKLFKNKSLALWLLAVWIVVGILGLSMYQLAVFNHYFGFLVPAAFLIVGLSLWFIWKINYLFKAIALSILAFLIFINLVNSPIRAEPNRQLEKTQKIAQILIIQTQGKPYNFALIAKNNYDAAYQYYLDLFNAKPAQVDFVQTDQLFVVCEDPVCQPISHPKSEIARFGFAKIDRRWDISGVKLFKLVKNPQGVPQTEIPPEEKISL